MNKSLINADNIYTLNALVSLLGYNRKTVEKHVSKKPYEITTVRHNNRDYTAYIINEDELKRLDFEISQNKNVINAQYKSVEPKITFKKNDSINAQNIQTDSVLPVYTNDMLRNVKQTDSEIIKLANENAELKHELSDLKDRYNTIEKEKIKLEGDKKYLENETKLITDKQRYIEGEVSKLTKENEQIEKDKKELLKKIDKCKIIIFSLGSIIFLALFTALIVFICYRIFNVQ